MRHAFLIVLAAFIIFIAQLLLWGGIVMVQAPAAHGELASALKLEMPQKVVPVILSYYPELNAMSYESSVGYCVYKDAIGMNVDVEGITDEYVCEVIDKGLVSNTEELRDYLARKVVAEKVDTYSLEYGPHATNSQLMGALFLIGGGFLAVAAFAVLYFGTKTFPKCLFWYSVLSALCAFGFMILSLLCFFILPGAVTGAAESSVEGGFESDVLALMRYTIEGVIEGLFIEPAFIFGGLAFFFSLLAALFYVMGMYAAKTDRTEKPLKEEKSLKGPESEND